MTANRVTASSALLETLDEALGLLEGYAPESGHSLDPSEPLPSLLSQCEAFCATATAPEAVRTIHHMACSGGTLISKCIAALPNSLLLSEINPLSTLNIKEGYYNFAPTDLLLALRKAVRPPNEETLTRVFLASVTTLLDECAAKGRFLVLRDHAHSNFCADPSAALSATLHEIITRELPAHSVVTVRHPLDSFLALYDHKWLHFSPATLEEYSLRYSAFLDRHADLPIVKYEDFVAAPEATIEIICGYLQLPYAPGTVDLISIIQLTGDSGRGSAVVIAPRPRRTVPDSIRADAETSHAYQTLCERLGYPHSADE